MIVSKRALRRALRPVEGEKRKQKPILTTPPRDQIPIRGRFRERKRRRGDLG